MEFIRQDFALFRVLKQHSDFAVEIGVVSTDSTSS
jgi:hypothetical protein